MAGRVFRGNAEVEIDENGGIIINPESGQEIDASGADLQNVGALEANGSTFKGAFATQADFDATNPDSGDYAIITEKQTIAVE